jgi:hypothetical protein
VRERKHTARLTLTAQVDIQLQQCFPQHNTFGKATIGHELNTTTTAAYWYLHEFFAFLEVREIGGDDDVDNMEDRGTWELEATFNLRS